MTALKESYGAALNWTQEAMIQENFGTEIFAVRKQIWKPWNHI